MSEQAQHLIYRLSASIICREFARIFAPMRTNAALREKGAWQQSHVDFQVSLKNFELSVGEFSKKFIVPAADLLNSSIPQRAIFASELMEVPKTCWVGAAERYEGIAVRFIADQPGIALLAIVPKENVICRFDVRYRI